MFVNYLVATAPGNGSVHPAPVGLIHDDNGNTSHSQVDKTGTTAACAVQATSHRVKRVDSV